jgi:hypothetical protein
MTGVQREAERVAPVGRAPTDEARQVEALRRGDEAAFVALLERYHGGLVRLATVYVGDRAVAEEVAQETWLGVLQGVGYQNSCFGCAGRDAQPATSEPLRAPPSPWRTDDEPMATAARRDQR